MRKVESKLFIEGENIYLREIQTSDVNKDYYNWVRDPEINQYLESRFEKWSIRKLKNYITKIKMDRDSFFWAIIHKESGKHIGNIKLGPVNRIHGFSDLGVIIAEKSYWGKGFATEAITLVVGYVFKKLKLNKLTAGVYANNIGSIKAFKKAGFLIEGRRKRQYLYNRKYVDAVLLGCIRK